MNPAGAGPTSRRLLPDPEAEIFRRDKPGRSTGEPNEPGFSPAPPASSDPQPPPPAANQAPPGNDQSAELPPRLRVELIHLLGMLIASTVAVLSLYLLACEVTRGSETLDDACEKELEQFSQTTNRAIELIVTLLAGRGLNR